MSVLRSGRCLRTNPPPALPNYTRELHSTQSAVYVQPIVLRAEFSGSLDFFFCRPIVCSCSDSLLPCHGLPAPLPPGVTTSDLPKVILTHELFSVAFLAFTWAACYQIQPSQARVERSSIDVRARRVDCFTAVSPPRYPVPPTSPPHRFVSPCFLFPVTLP